MTTTAASVLQALGTLKLSERLLFTEFDKTDYRRWDFTEKPSEGEAVRSRSNVELDNGAEGIVLIDASGAWLDWEDEDGNKGRLHLKDKDNKEKTGLLMMVSGLEKFFKRKMKLKDIERYGFRNVSV